MSKDDSFLYSGITSVTSEPMTPRQLQKFEKQHVKEKLKPATAIVLDAIEKEKNSIYDMRKLFVDSKTTDEEIRFERGARERYLNYLNGLEAKIKQIVKEPRKKSNE